MPKKKTVNLHQIINEIKQEETERIYYILGFYKIYYEYTGKMDWEAMLDEITHIN